MQDNSGRIAVAVYEVHYEMDPPDDPPPGWTPPTYGHYEVRYHVATLIGGKIPDKSSSEWVDAGFRESAVCTTYGASVNVDIPGTVNVVWFSLDKLEILKPNGAIIYNYAYSEGAEDARTPNKKLHTTLTFNGGEWDWGQAENGKAHCTAKDLEGIVFNLRAEAKTSKPSESDIKKECSEYLTKNMKAFIKEHFDVESDVLIFNTPSWQSNADDYSGDKGGYDADLSHLDDDVEIIKPDIDLPDEEIEEEEPEGVESDNVIFKEDTFAFEVNSALFSSEDGQTSEIDLTDDEDDAKSEYSAKLTFKNLNSFQLEDLRILAPSLSSMNNLFSNFGIEIPKKKLNTGSDGAVPTADSSLVISYTPARTISYGKADRYYKTDNVNKVVLHTPIAIKVSVKKAEDHLIQNYNGASRVRKGCAIGNAFHFRS